MRKFRYTVRLDNKCSLTLKLWLSFTLLFRYCHSCDPSNETCSLNNAQHECRQICRRTLIPLPPIKGLTDEEEKGQNGVEKRMEECTSGCSHWNTSQAGRCKSTCQGTNAYCTGCYIAEDILLSKLHVALDRISLTIDQAADGYLVQWSAEEGMNSVTPGIQWALQMKAVQPSVHSMVYWTPLDAHIQRFSNGSGSALVKEDLLKPFHAYKVRIIALQDKSISLATSRPVYIRALPLQPGVTHSLPDDVFELTVETAGEDQALLRWNSDILKYVPNILFQVITYDRTSKESYTSEELNRTLYLLSSLKTGHNYEATVKAVTQNGEPLGTSKPVVFELHEFKNISPPQLIYANRSQVSLLADLHDFTVQQGPLLLFTTKSAAISAITFGEGNIYAAVGGDKVYLIPMVPNQGSRPVAMLPISFPVKAMTFDAAQRRLLLASKNQIISCDLGTKRCETSLQIPDDLVDIVSDSANGYLYFSTQTEVRRCPLMRLRHGAEVNIFLSPFQQPIHLALDYATSSLVFNQNDSIFAFDFFASSVKDVRIGRLAAASKRTYANVRALTAQDGRIFWISSPCSDSISADDCCLFSEEPLPSGAQLNLHNFLLPPGHGQLVDIAISTSQLRYSVIQPPELSVFFLSNSVRLVWTQKKPLPFQSAIEWRHFKYEVEITDNDKMIFRKKQITDTSYSASKLTPNKKYLCRVRACLFESYCSNWAEAFGSTFDALEKDELSFVAFIQRQGVTGLALDGTIRQIESSINNTVRSMITTSDMPNTFYIFAGNTVSKSNDPNWHMQFAGEREPRAITYDPTGGEWYWCNADGVFRQSVNHQNPLRISAQAAVKWLELFTRHGILVMATACQISSIYLTGFRDKEYFACDNPDCSVLGIASNDEGANKIYYIIRTKDTIELRFSLVNTTAANSETVFKTGSATRLAEVWDNVKKMFHVYGKLFILTNSGQFVALENDLSQASIFPVENFVHDIVALPPEQSRSSGTKLPNWNLHIAWQKTSKQSPNIGVQWNDSGYDYASHGLSIQPYYNVSVSSPNKMPTSSAEWSLITEERKVSLRPNLLKSDEAIVNVTAFGLWHRKFMSVRMEVPSTYPLPPDVTTLNVAHVRTPFNITPVVRFSWSEPIWNGQPKSFKIYCWTFEPSSAQRLYLTKGVELNAREYYYEISNVNSMDATVYCQISAVNFGKGESRLSAPVNISTSGNSPAPVVLLVTSSAVHLYDMTYDFEQARSIAGTYEAVTYGGNFAYAIRSGMDGYSIVMLHLLDLTTIGNKLSISKHLVKASSITYDWVARRLLITGRSRDYFHTEGDSVWSVSDSLTEEPQQLLTTQPGSDIVDTAYDPFQSVIHLIISYGGKYMLKSWRQGWNKMLDCQCQPSSGVVALRYLDPALLKPLIYIITEDGVVDSQNCKPVIGQKSLSDINMNTVESLSIDLSYTYIVSGGNVYAYSHADHQLTIPNYDQVSLVRSVNPQYQPMPDYNCLRLPQHLKQFNIFAQGAQQIRVAIGLDSATEACESITPPLPTYDITFKPIYSDAKQCVGCIRHTSKAPSFLVNGVDQNKDYEIFVGWRNAFSTVEAYPVGLLSQYISQLVMVDELEAVPVAPDKVQLFWIPPVGDEHTEKGRNLEYQITVAQEEEQLPSETTTCPSLPCQYVVKSLKPSTSYVFQVYTTDIPRAEHPAIKFNKAVLVPATTYELPGYLSEDDVERTKTSLNFHYNLIPNSALKEIHLQYKTLGEQQWNLLEENHQQGGQREKWFRIDNLRPGTTCLLRAGAVYVTSYAYGDQVHNLREDFWQELQPLSSIGEQIATSAEVTVVETTSGYHLKWNRPSDVQQTTISLYVISYKLIARPNDKFDWIKLTELPASMTTWSIPDTVVISKESAFKVEAMTDDGLTPIGYWTKEPPEKSISAGAITAIIFATIILTAIILVILTCNLRRRRQKPKPAKAKLSSTSRVRTTPNNAEVLSQIPPADIEALPHIPRGCISLIRELGSGAFGEVYEGLAYNLPKFGSKTLQVAVKTLRPNSQPEQRVRFIKEAILMSRFDHPNVVALRGVCLETEPHWIILELMEAGDLLKYLRSVRATETMPSQVSLKDLVQIAIDVATGCAYLEHLHHVHRDLAARNCLITSRNPSMRVVKIGDFGLTRDLYEEDYYRVEGHGLLPVRWMAPESMIDGVFTTKSDVWSFGVLLWEVMSLGRQPYAGRTNWEVLNHVRIGGRLERPPSCPQEMFDLMQACWSFEANDRPTFSVVLNHLLKLKDLPEYQSEQPFPPHCNSVLSSDKLTSTELETDSSKGRSNETVQIWATRSSARFVRNKSAASTDSGKKQRGSSLRLLRHKKRAPVPRPPSKEEINAPPIPSFGTRSSQLSSSGTDSTVLLGSETYEVPLIKSGTSSVQEMRDSGHRNWAMDSEDTSHQSDSCDEPVSIPRRPKGPPPPAPPAYPMPAKRHSRMAEIQPDDKYENVNSNHETLKM